MGGGLMELIAKGAQDIYLTGNPNVTYFKSVFKRHTNFSMETIQQSFSGDLNFGKKLNATIKRTGDLLSGVTLEIDLPVLTGVNGNALYWTNSIGHSIIRSVELEMGGQIIDKQYGEWMEIWSELTTSEGHISGFKTMIGKNNTSQGILANQKNKLIVPLQFWFCKNIGLALPLVALQYHEIKIYVDLRPFNECWKKPVKRFYVSVNSSNQTHIDIISGGTGDINSSFLAPDFYTGQKIIWEEDGREETVSSRVDSDTIQMTSNSVAGRTGYMYLQIDEPDKIYELDDIRIYCDYIYLDTNERKYFAQNSHVYLIEQVQFNGNSSYISSQESNKIQMEFNHPCKELFWVSQIDLCRDFNLHMNFSDSVDITYGVNPVDNVLLYINGQERFAVRNANHFRLEIPYKRHTRVPDNFIYVYSFSLKPEQMQPSGTCNFSRLDSSELLINYKSNLLASNTRVYGLNYNILNVKNGMGGVAYSN
jgi:hypothetical protein